MRRGLLQILILSVAFSVTTLGLGWLAVPALGLLWGVVARHEERPALVAMLAAGLGWGWLLGWDAIVGETAELTRRVAGVLGVPGGAFVLLTLTLPTVTAWGAAVVGGAVRGRREEGGGRRERGGGSARTGEVGRASSLLPPPSSPRPMLTGEIELMGRTWQVREEKRQGPRPQIFVLTAADVPESEMHVRPLPGVELITIDQVRLAAVDPDTRAFADGGGMRWEARMVVASTDSGDTQLIKLLSYQAATVYEEAYRFADGLGLRTDDELRTLLSAAREQEQR